MIAQKALLAGISLIGVLALIGLVAKLARQRLCAARPQAGRALALRETVAIDQRRRLHLIACGERQVLLLTGGTQDLVVGWLADK